SCWSWRRDRGLPPLHDDARGAEAELEDNHLGSSRGVQGRSEDARRVPAARPQRIELIRLSGRTAVVTGASRGIGEAISSALAGKGARVVLVARNESRLKEVARRLKESIPIACDVS